MAENGHCSPIGVVVIVISPPNPPHSHKFKASSNICLMPFLDFSSSEKSYVSTLMLRVKSEPLEPAKMVFERRKKKKE